MPQTRIEISIGAKDSPVLQAYMADRTSKVCFIMGPLGSGKTYGSIQRLLKQCTEQPPNKDKVRPTRWFVVRNTYSELMNTTVKDFLEVFTEPTMGRMVKGGTQPPTFYANFFLPDGTNVQAEFVFFALDRPAHEGKQRGTQPTGWWFNETKEMRKAFIDMADGRCGRYPSEAAGGVRCGWRGIIGDTNAPDDDSWYHRLAEETKPEGWTFYRQAGGVVRTGEENERGEEIWRENPDAENLYQLKKNFPEGYYSGQLPGKEQDWIRVNLANEYGFLVDGKPVHPGFIEAVHCLREAPSDRWIGRLTDLIIGVDFGRTPAAAIIGYDEVFGRYIAFDEFVTDDMSASLFGPELKLYLDRTYPGKGIRAWGDPAGNGKGEATEDSALDIMRAKGIPIQAAPSNTTALRRAAVAFPLRENALDGKPRLLVAPKAKMLVKGLKGGFCYRRLQRAGAEQYTEEPDKNQYSHIVEALEYGLLGAGEYHMAMGSKMIRDRGGRGRSRQTRMAKVG